MSEAQIAKALDLPYAKLEGLLLPETYNYTKGMSDLDVLKRAAVALQTELDVQWNDRQNDLPLKSAYEALILASIIEKETAEDSERAKVASVFINRLNIGMKLQTDPTVIYGMGDRYQGNIRRSDLRRATPYNTYVIYGLPPTPIAMVSKKSIQAATHPDKTKYLYFVATGKGGHVFNTNLKDHNRSVQAYLKVLRSQK
ncbi:MAG: endolytic transglycosylase MltG, partial [Vibrio sp.]